LYPGTEAIASSSPVLGSATTIDAPFVSYVRCATLELALRDVLDALVQRELHVVSGERAFLGRALRRR